MDYIMLPDGPIEAGGLVPTRYPAKTNALAGYATVY